MDIRGNGTKIYNTVRIKVGSALFLSAFAVHTGQAVRLSDNECVLLTSLLSADTSFIYFHNDETKFS